MDSGGRSDGDRSATSSARYPDEGGWTEEMMFAELVAEMHEQVRLAIDVHIEPRDR